MAEYFTDKSNGHRFRVQAGNGEILMTSESYTTAQGAERGYEALVNAIHQDGGCRFQERIRYATSADSLDWAARCLHALQSDGTVTFNELSEDIQIEYSNLASKLISGLLMGTGRK